MMKDEFLQAAGIENISQADYEVIELVYTHHPSIDNSNGKKQIATIYNLPGGMRIIRDMVPTAELARQIHDRQFHLRSEIAELEAQYDKLAR
ncbi:MAG: hypothetical protein EOM68_25455 [Spirochaetia bacterium]|nr:hypothetical protein [Spirochaetia bacterium]